MPREVQLRLSRPGRAVPVAQPAAASGGANQDTGTPGARRRGGVPLPEPEPEPEPEPQPQTRGPPRAELRPRPSSARPRTASAAGAAAGDDAAAQVVVGLHAARPSTAGGQGWQSRQRVRQQQQAAARLSNPLVPAVSRGQRRPNAAAPDVVDSPPPGGDIGLGLRRRRPASAGPARQRPAARASAAGSPRASAGQMQNSAGTPRRAASSNGNDAGGEPSPVDGVSAGRGRVTPSQASSQQPQRSAAAELMARRGISPGGVQQRLQPRQRPSSAPVRRSGSRDEAQRVADARRSAAVKSPGARARLQEPSHRGGWVSARANVSGAAEDANAAAGRKKQSQPAVSPGEPLPVPGVRSPSQLANSTAPGLHSAVPNHVSAAVSSLCMCVQHAGRMRQRRVSSNNSAGAHVMPGSSPASHRVRQRNGFLRPSSAGVISSAHLRPAPVR